jgi:hypothetical protein
MLQSILFKTKPGEWFLILLEHWTGLAIVRADWLGEQMSLPPTKFVALEVARSEAPAQAVESKAGAADTRGEPHVREEFTTTRGA